MESSNGVRRPQIEDLYIVPPLAILLLVVRFLFEKFVAKPFCRHINIEDKPRKLPEPNAICEKVFKTVSKNPDATVVKGLCQQLEWREFQVKLWFTRRRNASKLPMMRKATESCWRFLFYIIAFIYGFGVLIRKDWFLQPTLWFEGHIITQNLDRDIQWYYIIELSFYMSLLSSVLIDNKRKDFWEMTIHHIVTIILIGTSYITAQYRIGSVIIVVHDCSDYWLESAKVFNYAKMKRTCDGLFVGFALTFFLSRWVIYPFWVIKNFLKSRSTIGSFHSNVWFGSLLFVLQILHIIWGFAVGRVVYHFTIVGKEVRDVRSEDEDEDPVEEREPVNSMSKKKK